MNTYPNTDRKIGAYKWVIEALYEQARSSVQATRIRKSGHPETTDKADIPLLEPENAKRKEFFLSLKAADREMLAKLLEDERMGALQDVASFLEGYLGHEEPSMAPAKKDIPANSYWSMHEDFIDLITDGGWRSGR